MRFSALTFIKEKYRNSLGEEHPRHLALSYIESRVLKIVARVARNLYWREGCFGDWKQHQTILTQIFIGLHSD